MNLTGPQTRRKSDSAPAGRVPPANSGPGAAKGTGQAKMPPRQNLALVRARLARELRADEAPHSGGRSAVHRALYPV